MSDFSPGWLYSAFFHWKPYTHYEVYPVEGSVILYFYKYLWAFLPPLWNDAKLGGDNLIPLCFAFEIIKNGGNPF